MTNTITNTEFETLELIDSLQRQLDEVRSEVEAEATTRLTDIRRMRTVVIALTIGWAVTTLGLIQVIQGQ
jgi:hypothetical protein